MFPKDWTQPCGNCCTKKYAGVFLIPWRIFCKKGCSADGDTWAECVEACNELCYKDPVLKDRQWTSFIDRSPGDDNYSLVCLTISFMGECFHACVAGCGFKFGISPEKVDQVQPNRPIPLPPPPPSPMPDKSTSTLDAEPTCDDLPGTSA
ncbi:hypothetical protein IEQ34_014770 [Dendrobium chrysotoxum]|uniref:Uncharacterized protein n=1 Tax=Dendrobium chrysotoxum TaxID=161865 RepID=A0AAV7GMI8_DENCH|nr:hypothetical protein IEQ34_014770 [Dendrobium chrysotoxum]